MRAPVTAQQRVGGCWWWLVLFCMLILDGPKRVVPVVVVGANERISGALKPERSTGSGSQKVLHCLVKRACRGVQKGGPSSRSSEMDHTMKMMLPCSGRRPPKSNIENNF